MPRTYQYETKLFCVFFKTAQEPIDVYAMDTQDMMLTLKENILDLQWHDISHIEEHSCPTDKDVIH